MLCAMCIFTISDEQVVLLTWVESLFLYKNSDISGKYQFILLLTTALISRLEIDTVNKIFCKCLSLRDTILGVYVRWLS